MFKNYFYLLRGIKELNIFLKNRKITEVYTQEKDKLFVGIPNIGRDNFHVVVSTNPQLSFITVKDEHHKAKKNVRTFFDNFLPDIIQKVQIALGDRIIKFTLAKSSLYFVIKGAATNLFLIDDSSEINCFKKVEAVKLGQIKKEILSAEYIDDAEALFDILKNKSKEEIIKTYKFIDKDIIRELDRRTGNWNLNLINIINEIQSSAIAVVLNENMSKPILIPETFLLADTGFIFQDYFTAVNKYFSLFFTVGKDKLIKTEIEKFIEKELERTANKLNTIKSRIENGSKEEDYFYKANLLLANIHSIKKGMKEIYAEDFEANNVLIKLDEKLSPQQNIDLMFEKARSEKINYQKSKELFTNLEKDYEKLINFQKTISESSTLEQLLVIKKDLKIKMENQKKDNDRDRIFNFRHFIIDGKYHLYVGKDSKNNDLLTTRFAKQNDFWFHARSVSGSHAVLRVENTKEAVPKNILKKAASVAAFYSKSKTSKLAPVSYTFKKFVVKKKDLDPGQVYLLKENVILVPPEIPQGTEMIDDD